MDELLWEFHDIAVKLLKNGITKENMKKAIDIIDINDEDSFEFHKDFQNEINKMTSN